MRTIKFRAWSKKHKLLIHQKDFSTYAPIKYRTLEDYINNPTWLLMQYTGLKDKNGVEIYEGDIICTRYKKSGEIYEKDSVKWGVYNIGCNGYEYDFEIIGAYVESEYLYGLMVQGGDIEVIGNIHENPELIK